MYPDPMYISVFEQSKVNELINGGNRPLFGLYYNEKVEESKEKLIVGIQVENIRDHYLIYIFFSTNTNKLNTYLLCYYPLTFINSFAAFYLHETFRSY